jgi:hypothetical protein
MADETKGPALSAEDKRTREVERQLQEIKLQSAQLELEDLTARVEKERARREQMIMSFNAQMRTLADNDNKIKLEQTVCAHRKGGMGMDGILNGHDPFYSVIKHTYPWGATQVKCSRCSKEWNAPEPALRKSDRAEYDRQLAEYKVALALPTDNQPSGTQLFIIHRPAPTTPARRTA